MAEHLYTPGSGGSVPAVEINQTLFDTDSGYPTTGRPTISVLYASQDVADAPEPLSLTNPIPVVDASGDTLYIAGVAHVIKRAFANASASGDTTVVNAVTGKKIRVLSFVVGPVSAAVSVSLKSATAGAITSTKHLAANGGFGRAPSPYGYCETVAGEALVVTLSGTADVGVDVLYIEV